MRLFSMPPKSRMLIAKSLLLAFSSSAPLISALTVLLLFRLKFGDVAVLTLGMAGNILGIAVAMSAGCMVMAVRRFSNLRSKNSDSKSFQLALRSENNSGYLVGLFSLFIVACLSVVVPLGTAVPATSLHIYFLSISVWFLVLPLTQVAYGVLQAFGREREVLTTSLAVLVLQLAGVFVVVRTVDALDDALLAAGIVQSTVALGVLLYRLSLIKRLVGGSLEGTFSPKEILTRVSSVPDRLMAGGDGLIYMGVFAAATYVASLSSVSDGALVALIVSYMRLVVIPIKQFGLVGGRLLLQKTNNSGIESFKDVRAAALLPCLIAGVIAGGLSLVLLPVEIGWLVAVMTMIQLGLEPRSGVMFALSKVVFGPRLLFSHLVVLYIVILPIAWSFLVLFNQVSVFSIWFSIFAVRCILTITISFQVNRYTR